MCCFSGPVQDVSNTRIFARVARPNRQFLAYQMDFSIKTELAMILPVPVASDADEQSVRFITLERYPDFFEELTGGFPQPRHSLERGGGPVAAAAPPPPLEVKKVGSFEASFVPRLKDFSRLDKRFRISSETWDRLPAYGTYGFAVFKLRKDAQTVHPMAFEFLTSDPTQLFFPTVHIHDGAFHTTADFSHSLYCQVPEGSTPRRTHRWEESAWLASQFMKVDKSGGLIDPNEHCYRVSLTGELPNQDTWA